MDAVIIVILEIGLIATFISLFFFLYVVKVEDEIITAQTVKASKRLLMELEVFSPNIARGFKSTIKKLDLSSAEADDSAIQENNKKLIQEAIITVVILMVICLVLATGFYVWKGGDIPQILFSTFCAVAVVALVEYCFLEFFVRNYQIVDPNIVRRAFLKGLNKYIKNSTLI
jgi:hypothetical protein